jgi:hypothetical protein
VPRRALPLGGTQEHLYTQASCMSLEVMMDGKTVFLPLVRRDRVCE